jgi:molybdopterin-binding protein
MGGAKMELSARNQLGGKVLSLKLGNVMAEVVIKLKGGEEVVSVITRQSAEALGLKEGADVKVVIKATSVMVSK